MSIFSIVNIASEITHHPAWVPIKTNSTFSSIIGSTNSFVIGTGSTSNIFSSSISTITNLQEMARLVWNGDPHGGVWNWLLNFFVYGSGGGQTSYIFGASKALNYRLSHNFKVDRYHQTLGALGTKKGLAARQADPNSHIHDITWTPVGESKNRYMLLAPIMFSLGLLAWDLIIVYKFKIASITHDAPKDLDGNASKEDTGMEHTGMKMLVYLEVFEEVMIQFMEILERFLCLKDTAKNEANGMKESVGNLEKKIGDAGSALAQAQALAATNPEAAAPTLVVSQKQIQTTSQAAIVIIDKTVPNVVDNVKASLAVDNSGLLTGMS